MAVAMAERSLRLARKEAIQVQQERALARTIWAHERNRLARPQRHFDASERFLAIGVTIA
jgi:hypothetical protein